MNDPRPRDYALTIMEAWVEGGEFLQAIAAIPAQSQELAKAHARGFADQVRFHHKHGTAIERIKGTKMQDWVVRYREHRRRSR